MEDQVVAPSVKKYDDRGKTEILFQLSKPQGKVFPFYPPTEMIPAQSEIYFIPEKLDENGNGTGVGDETKAENRLIAFLPGMKSIFVDEWTDRDKERLEKDLKSIKFTNGFKPVGTREKTLLQYMRLAGYNKANDDLRVSPAVLYREVDYEAEAKKVNILENELIQARYFVMNNPIDEVRAYAEALCKTQAEVEAIKMQGDEEVRYRLRDISNSNPEIFVKEITDPAMRNRVFIARALQKGIIKSDNEDSEFFWSSNDQSICRAPSGMKIIPYFAELSVKNDKYAEVLKSIKKMLNEDVEEDKELDWVDTMVKQAINKGVIVQSNNWLFFGEDEKTKEPIMRFNGMKNIRAAMESNEDNIVSLISMAIKSAEDSVEE